MCVLVDSEVIRLFLDCVGELTPMWNALSSNYPELNSQTPAKPVGETIYATKWQVGLLRSSLCWTLLFCLFKKKFWSRLATCNRTFPKIAAVFLLQAFSSGCCATAKIIAATPKKYITRKKIYNIEKIYNIFAIAGKTAGWRVFVKKKEIPAFHSYSI